MQRITEVTEKMLRLINELIDLMGIGRIVHDFSEVSLHALAGEAVEPIQERISERNISVHIADNLPLVYGDPKRLLENAVKFMGDQPEPKIEFGMREEAGGAIFYVRDNGIGVEPRFSERIFSIFQKLDAMSEGTGIGLALV